MSSPLVRQCCRCHLIMDDGDGGKVRLNYNATTWKGLTVSHGYCPACRDVELAKIKVLKKQRERLPDYTDRDVDGENAGESYSDADGGL